MAQQPFTRYELALEHEDGRRYLVCYTPRKSRHGLADAVRDDARWRAILGITGVTRWHLAPKASDGVLADGWRIHFTGRTKLEAIREELPFILAA